MQMQIILKYIGCQRCRYGRNKRICDGDYCGKCFKEKVGKIPEWEE